MKNSKIKKSLSLFLSLLMIFTMIPATTFTSFAAIESPTVSIDSNDDVTIETNSEITSQLETPVISLDGTILTIEPVENVDVYEIYIDEELIDTVTETTIDLNNYEQFDSKGCYKIYVIAKNEQSNKLSSEKSNVVYYDTVNTLISYSEGNYFWNESYYPYIIEINFVNNTNIPNDAIDSWDIGEEQNESILSWITGTEEKGYVLYIGSKGRILAPTDCSYYFYYFTNLKTINNLEKFNTSNVKNMFWMFLGCENLTIKGLTLPASAKLTCMFGKGPKNMDLSGVDVSNVTDMSELFAGCTTLESLNLSGWDTSKVTNMYSMFDNCSSLTSINFGDKWNTSNVTNMIRMFKDCSSLTTLDLNDWDTSNLKTISNMFLNCSSLVSLNIGEWDTSNVVNMGIYMTNNGLFSNCSSLKSIDLNNWDTSNVKYMEYMFSGCTSLENINISNWNTSNVTNMNSMFKDCSSLTSLNLNEWNISNVTDMNYMFYKCSSLANLDLSGWNTLNATQMTQMFYKCSSLTSLDLSNWNTSNVTNMSSMFNDCSSLKRIYIGNNWNVNKVKYSTSMFANCIKILGDKDFSYDSTKINKTYATTNYYMTHINNKSLLETPVISLSDTILTIEPVENADYYEIYLNKELIKKTENTTFDLINYEQFDSKNYYEIYVIAQNSQNDKISSRNSKPVYYDIPNKLISYSNEQYFWSSSYKSRTTEINFVNHTNVPSNATISWDVSGKQDSSVLAWIITERGLCKLYIGSNEKIIAPVDCSNYFYNFYSLTTINGLENFDTSNVTNMSNMFNGCSKLEKIYIGDNWNTNSVTSSYNMFYNCTKLPNFNSSKVDKTNAHCGEGGYLTHIDDKPIETTVLGDNTQLVNTIAVKEKDYIVYTLDLTYSGPGNSNEIKVIDQLPAGLTFIEDYFNTTFVSNVSDYFVTEPTYNTETNTIEYTLNNVPSDTVIKVQFACQINEISNNEDVKFFYNTPIVIYNESTIYSNTSSEYILNDNISDINEIQTYTVTYKYVGDVPENIKLEKTMLYISGCKVDLLLKPSKAGYETTEWVITDNEGNEIIIDENGCFEMPENDITITSTWNKIKIPVSNIVIPEGNDNITLYVGNEKEINATVLPENADYGLTYKSSNPDIAKVTNSGKIIANKIGSTTIIVKSEDNGIEKIIKVNVVVDPTTIATITFKETETVNQYLLFVDNEAVQVVNGNSSIQVEKGSMIIIKANNPYDTYNYFVNGSYFANNANVSLILNENIEIYCVGENLPEENPDDTPDNPDEPQLNWFQKLIKLIKDFFAKLFGKK